MLASAAALAISPDELLDPEKAFRISARVLDLPSVEVEFKIARGLLHVSRPLQFRDGCGPDALRRSKSLAER